MDRFQIAKGIEDKLSAVNKLRNTLEHRKQTLSSSIDDQILLAETECHLAQEEVTLLSLQEKHWESAALCKEEPEFQSPLCEVLHSHILSLEESGAIPTLHAIEYLAVENALQISSQAGRPSIPVVEWAQETSELRKGDRLLEVNGLSLIGMNSREVTRLLCSSSSLCRVVFLRPLHVNQLFKNFRYKEVSNLRHELTSVVNHLNFKIAQSKSMANEIMKLKKTVKNLRESHQKLMMQVFALQKMLWLFFNAMEKNMMHSAIELFKNLVVSNSLQVWTLSCLWLNELTYNTHFNIPDMRQSFPANRKSIPWCEMVPYYSNSNSASMTEERTSSDTESKGFMQGSEDKVYHR